MCVCIARILDQKMLECVYVYCWWPNRVVRLVGELGNIQLLQLSFQKEKRWKNSENEKWRPKFGVERAASIRINDSCANK